MGLPFPRQGGWIIILFWGEYSACALVQPSPAQLGVWVSSHPNSCSVSLLAALWAQNLWGEGLPQLNLPSYTEESPVQSLFLGRGSWEQGTTKCAQHTGTCREKQHLGCKPLHKNNVFHIKFTSNILIKPEKTHSLSKHRLVKIQEHTWQLQDFLHFSINKCIVELSSPFFVCFFFFLKEDIWVHAFKHAQEISSVISWVFLHTLNFIFMCPFPLSCDIQLQSSLSCFLAPWEPLALQESSFEKGETASKETILKNVDSTEEGD